MTASDGRGQRLRRRGMSSVCTRRFGAGLGVATAMALHAYSRASGPYRCRILTRI